MKGVLVALIALAAVVVGIELAAIPVAEATLRSELEEAELPVDELEVTGIGRPAFLGVVTGWARDLEVELRGVDVDGWRFAEASLTAPEVELPWAFDERDPAPAGLRARATQRDLQAELRSRAPAQLDPVLELTPGTASLGVESLPVTLQLAVEVADGVLTVAPGRETPEWLEGLDLSFEFELPEELRIDTVTIEDGALVLTAELDLATLADQLEGSPAAADVGQGRGVTEEPSRG